jgi:polyisoprenoid-binding protein YceI
MTDPQTQTRTWQDLEVPPAGTYDIDPAHTEVEIIARHMMIAKVRGRFEEFSGHLVVGEDPTASRVEVQIEAGSINTNESSRDEHLRSADFLDVEQWPHIRVVGEGPKHLGGKDFRITAELTIRDVTKPVDIDFSLEGVTIDPWGNTRAFFSGAFSIKREEFGVTWNQALETGGVMVGPELKAELEVQAVLREG